jgi:hypothetical protein
VNKINTGMIIHASDSLVPALYGLFTPGCAKLVALDKAKVQFRPCRRKENTTAKGWRLKT